MSATLNWQPTLPDPPAVDPTQAFGVVRKVHGIPDNEVGENGDIAVDLDNGDIYSKAGDVWLFWT